MPAKPVFIINQLPDGRFYPKESCLQNIKLPKFRQGEIPGKFLKNDEYFNKVESRREEVEERKYFLLSTSYFLLFIGIGLDQIVHDVIIFMFMEGY